MITFPKNITAHHFDTHEQFLEIRRSLKGVGGSDAGAVMGLSPYRSALDVYNDKVHGVQQEATPIMNRGSLMEPFILKMIGEKYPEWDIHEANAVFTNERFPHCFASPDAIAECDGDRFGIEIKAPGSWAFQKMLDEGAPPVYYEAQCQLYMDVLELDYWKFFALDYDSWDLLVYTISNDRTWGEAMLGYIRRFWDKVEAKTPPEQKRAVIAKPVDPEVRELELDDEITKMLLLYHNNQKLEKDVKEIIKGLQEKIKTYCSINKLKKVSYNDISASYSVIEGRESFDNKLFKANNPDLDLSPYIKRGDDYERVVIKRTKSKEPKAKLGGK